MSFNKYYLPDPEIMITNIIQTGAYSFVSKKADVVVGSDDSMKIWKFVGDLVKSKKSEVDILTALTKKFPRLFNNESS